MVSTTSAPATSYEPARSTDPEFYADCETITTSETYWIDTEPVPVGSCHYYLVHSLMPNVGSWGVDSTGSERAGVCP